MTIPLCKNCKHLGGTADAPICLHEDAPINYVTGEKVGSPQDIREEDVQCGHDGYWFEPATGRGGSVTAGVI